MHMCIWLLNVRYASPIGRYEAQKLHIFQTIFLQSSCRCLLLFHCCRRRRRRRYASIRSYPSEIFKTKPKKKKIWWKLWITNCQTYKSLKTECLVRLRLDLEGKSSTILWHFNKQHEKTKSPYLSKHILLLHSDDL